MSRTPSILVAKTFVALTLLAGRPAVAAETDGSAFTLSPSFDDREIYDTYERLVREGKPLFISNDLALHTSHLLFDYSLRSVESEHLFADLKRLTTALLEASRFQDARRADAGPSVTGYLAVAARLLDPGLALPPNIAESVDRDLALIEKHEGGALSHVLESVEDFSQYVPRGHYTRNEEFARYFQAMMWYGRRMFRVEESRPRMVPPPAQEDRWSDDLRRTETRMMLKLSWLLFETPVGNERAVDVWRRLYSSTVLFSGKTEDLTPEQIKALAEALWGALPPPEGIAKLSPAELDRFARVAAESTQPKVDSSGAGRKGFCLMAQRFTPDGYVLQTLVTDAGVPFGNLRHPLVYQGMRKVKPFTWGANRYLNPPERRFMPRGLDVMSVLGSSDAAEIIAADGDAEYEGYADLVARLVIEVQTLRRERRDESVYYAWLDVLAALVEAPPESKAPAVFRSPAWNRKRLSTALASWTELRHDTLLYVKQSYTPNPRSLPSPEAFVYVEPTPEVYMRSADVVGMMRDRLQAQGILPAALAKNYDAYVKIMHELEQAAREELAGRPLSPEVLRSLRTVPARLKNATRLPPAAAEKLLGKADGEMSLVADVHTNSNDAQVLQQAVGRPLALTMTLPRAEGLETFHGAAFSYYEFKHPMNDRLTDEAWQSILADPNKRPALPTWYPAGTR